jgi:general secretion pathway protein K
LAGHERFQLTNASADASWASEAGRLDINLAPGDLISSLLVRMGAEPSDAEIFTANIVGRRRQGPIAQSTLRPVNMTPFRHLRELAGLGIPDSLLTRLKPFLTVYSGTAKIDPRVAAVDLLASLPGLTEARMRGLAGLRMARSDDPNAWVSEAAEAASYLQFAPPKAVRFRIDGRAASGGRRLAEIVAILFSDDTEPYRILDWDYVESDRDLTPLDTAGP